ncbi:TetR family transcriptional regulator [Brevibacillus panacihumi W25]|uniref:TetR family transcriptional regulator n=1 Tax=Brevibacillus panacihumi W25 TaxID=1408254 RepID=V6MA05_9BACL|nr:TetR/AcrR family transcriptional regulator [Brevibacillus panacihumi]EST54710.1 TetR family transcriptional regulator [Brevibacillus panacihumi W25]
MPKIVDHEERRKQIAEATWRVILRWGMKGATVRKIAQEAGVSLGALRHYFTTQDELLLFAMKLVKERAAQRIREVQMRDLCPKEMVIQILLEILPVDEQRMAEMEVWFAFVFHQKYRESESEELQVGFFPQIRSILSKLQQQDLLKKGLDLETEAEKLYAIIDGIAVHAMLESQRLLPERIERVLRHHLDSIFKAD